MPILFRISGFLLTGAGAFVVQNNPGEVRNNICAWDFVAPCADWFDSAALNQVVSLCLMAVSGLFFLSLIIPLLAKNYRQTVTEIAQFAPPKKPPEPQSEAHDFALANLDEWRNVDPLELFRAGCLWKGFQPHHPIGFNDPAYASYIMLVNAVKAGQLAITNPGTEVDAWSLVSRSELARFAGTKGDVPEFLSKSRSITPNFAVERRQIAETEIATLTADEKAALRQMLITGRPKNLSDQIWQSLEMKTSFVESDFTGPKGIKNEFRSVLGELLGPNREPIVLAELEMTVPKIGDFTPVCSIRIKNTGPPLEDKCLVKVEKHGLENHMPDPLVVRTEGQIRNDRTGPFTLRAGEPKLVPILFRDPGRINEFRFLGEGKNHYSFIGDSAEFEVAIYGAEHPTRVSVRLNVGEDWKVHAEMEYC